jgi:hypothetical protein
MRKPKAISRRQFVASAMSVAAVSSIAVPEVFGKAAKIASSANGKMSDISLTDAPPWKDQAIENLAKSPYAKLRQIASAGMHQNGFGARGAKSAS